ncbi:MAG: LytTR family DNA-binding domain-containing protein [Bacteroidota bacterium]
MNSWLNQPYPLIQKSRQKAFLIIASSLFVYIFLLIYQPFGGAEVPNKPLFFVGFALSVMTGLSAGYILFPSLFPPWFQAEEWTIRKEILLLGSSLLIISILNYLYNSIAGANYAPQHSLLAFVGITLAVGIFPILGMIFLVELYLNKHNQKLAQQLVVPLGFSDPIPTVNPALITFTSEAKKPERLTVYVDEFLFATSDSNYITIFYERKGKLNRKLLRLSLKKVENQLSHLPSIIRCHKSYLINQDKIQHINGNARSLTLTLVGYTGSIPVSRNYAKEFLISGTLFETDNSLGEIPA